MGLTFSPARIFGCGCPRASKGGLPASLLTSPTAQAHSRRYERQHRTCRAACPPPPQAWSRAFRGPLRGGASVPDLAAPRGIEICAPARGNPAYRSSWAYSVASCRPFAASHIRVMLSLPTVTVLSPFAGIVADPLQRRLSLHRCLQRLIDALGRQWVDGTDGAIVVRDHDAARPLDFLDLLASAWRLARS
jgi:hypothetical protein